MTGPGSVRGWSIVRFLMADSSGGFGIDTPIRRSTATGQELGAETGTDENREQQPVRSEGEDMVKRRLRLQAQEVDFLQQMTGVVGKEVDHESLFGMMVSEKPPQMAVDLIMSYHYHCGSSRDYPRDIVR